MARRDPRYLAAAGAYSAVRVAYGIGLLAAPARVARPWVGELSAESPPVQLGLGALGARDAIASAGVAGTLATGNDPRPWLAACVIGDLADIAATARARSALPPRAFPGTLAAAGGFAALGAVLGLLYES